MLYVTVGEKQYRIRWSHTQEPPPVGSGTTCWIEDEHGGLLRSGYSFLHPKDRFDKEVGRKVSLAKALQGMWPSETDPAAGEHYSARTAVWSAYHSRKGR